MQTQHLKLKEIIWEITGECHNGCLYCGSKSVRNIVTPEETILKIAEAIAQYPPEEINISGGDPMVIFCDIHDKILAIFKEKNIICKILLNPNSYAFEIARKYDWVGISINTKEELKTAQAKFELSDLEKYTVITNFNIQNLYNFDLIEAFVKEQNKAWTIQFTVYDDPNNLLALYHPDNEEAFNFLKEKVKSSDARIILSDNIRNDVSCSAGIASIGIAYDGTVIPCLSMRSWTNPTKDKEHLNILKTPLGKIWVNGFKAQRFGSFKCCKDACKNKFLPQKGCEEVKIIEIPQSKQEDWKKLLEEIVKKRDEKQPLIQFPQQPPFLPNGTGAIMYGVSPGMTLLYGIARDNVYYYGVSLDSGTLYTNAGTKNSTDSPDETEIK